MVEASGPTPLRIVFFGTPQFALPSLGHLLETRHRVVGVLSRSDKPKGRGHHVSDTPVKALALQHGIPVFQPERVRDPDVMTVIGGWAPDLGVVSAYGQIIPASVLDIPPLGMINVHASLLPKYRGAAPVHRAVINGERETGVTIMRVTPALDAGPMLGAVKRPIGPDETSAEVERGLASMGAALLVDVVEQIAAGSERSVPQDDSLSTYAPRLSKEEGLVDWSLRAQQIHDLVRGLHPWPHAYTYLAGARIILLKTHVAAGPEVTAVPGTVVSDSRDALGVATGHGGVLAIDLLQPEGRRPMGPRNFLAARSVPPGSRLSAQPELSP